MSAGKTVLVTDSSHYLYGQRLKGGISYHDYYHTGNGPDLFSLETANGEKVSILSTGIDVADFNEQCLAEVVADVGVSIGDIVIVEKFGSGCYAESFSRDGENVVSGISADGSVSFNDNTSYSYKPVLRVVKKAESVCEVVS